MAAPAAGKKAAQPMPPLPVMSADLGRAYGMRGGSAFMQGLLGGLLGSGFAGLVYGSPFFSAYMTPTAILGLLLQLILLVSGAAWLARLMSGGLASAEGGGVYTRLLHPGIGRAAPVLRRAPGHTRRSITLNEVDVRGFLELLRCMQAAWCAHDMQALRSMTTPSMAEEYAEQIATQAARGEHDVVSALEVQRSEVVESWSDGLADFACLKVRYAMIDQTVDGWGRVVGGCPNTTVVLTERWSFTRQTRAKWVVSSIEQAP